MKIGMVNYWIGNYKQLHQINLTFPFKRAERFGLNNLFE